MTSTAELTTLTVTLEGDIGLTDAGRADVARYLQRLCSGLGLPVTAVTSTHASGAGAPRVRIGERRAAIVAPGPGGDDGAFERVALTLLRNRELLLTDAAVQAIYDAWAPDTGWASELAPLLRECVRYGHSVEHLQPLIASGAPQDRDALLEAVLARGVPRLRLALAPADHARAFDEDGVARPLEGEESTMEQMVELVSEGLFWELGALVGITVDVDDDLAAGSFRLEPNDVCAPAQRGLTDGTCLTNETPERLELLGIAGATAVTNPGSGFAGALVGDAQRQSCLDAGLTTWVPEGYCLLAASGELRRNAAAFLTSRTVELLIHRLRETYPVVVDHCLERYEQVCVARVLRRLLEEQISIRDLRGILEALLRVDGITSAAGSQRIIFAPHSTIRFPIRDGREVDALRSAELAECARTALRRAIAYKYARGQDTLDVYLLDPAIEARLLRCDRDALSDAERDEILAAVGSEVGELSALPTNPVLLTSIEIRHRTRALVQHEFPHLAVVSYSELPSELSIRPRGRVSLL